MKKLLKTLVFVLIGIVIGVGGTLGFQSIFSKTAATKTVAAPQKDGPLVSIGDFMVNLQTGGFLKTTITVEGVDAKAEQVLKDKSAFMIDRVNMVLSSQSISGLQTPQGKEKLRQELIKNLNEVTGNEVQDVLFVSFIYQSP